MNTYVFLVSICLVAIKEAASYGTSFGKRGKFGETSIGVFDGGIGGVNQRSIFGEGLVGETTGQEGFGTVSGEEFGVAGGHDGVRRGLVRKGIFRGVGGQSEFGSGFCIGSATGGVDIRSGVRGSSWTVGCRYTNRSEGCDRTIRSSSAERIGRVAVQPGVGVLTGVKGVAVQPGVGVLVTGVRGVAAQLRVGIRGVVGQPEDVLTGQTTFGERMSGQTGFAAEFDGRTSEQGRIVGEIDGQIESSRRNGQSHIIKKSGYGGPGNA